MGTNYILDTYDIKNMIYINLILLVVPKKNRVQSVDIFFLTKRKILEVLKSDADCDVDELCMTNGTNI